MKEKTKQQKVKKTQTIVKILKILYKEQKNLNGTTMLGSMQNKYTKWQILISTILSARSKDETTETISKELFKKYPNAKKLAFAKQSDVEKLIKKSGFYKNKAKNIINASKQTLKGVPNTMQDLIKLPGVGRKVAGCVLVYAYKKDAIPVDTHVHRLSNRLKWVSTKTPEKTEKALESIIPKKYWKIVNDVLVWHGKTICKPINPQCSKCKIKKDCPSSKLK